MFLVTRLLLRPRWSHVGLWGLSLPPPSLAVCPPQLFNIYPRLGALLQLHRPVLRKINEVRAILRALLEARRPPAPGGGPVHSYVDALRQQGQVWASPPPPPQRPGASGPHLVLPTLLPHRLGLP